MQLIIFSYNGPIRPVKIPGQGPGRGQNIYMLFNLLQARSTNPNDTGCLEILPVKYLQNRVVKSVATTIGEYIKRDHDDFRLMFERLWNSTPDEIELRQQVYPFLRNRILAHHVGEEATIFPVMEKTKDLEPIALLLIEEHRGMAMLANDLAETPYNDRLWRPRIFPFYDVICNHWKREEADLFPHAWFYYSRQQLEDFGTAFDKVLRREWKLKGLHQGVPKIMYRR